MSAPIGSLALSVVLLLYLSDAVVPGQTQAEAPVRMDQCFLLHEIGVGEIRRDPSAGCTTRVTPASTFKVPHALAALDAGVLSGPDERLTFDGTGDWPASSRRDHTLVTAVRHSVLWYFQRVAERLGPAREASYLQKLGFGNRDSSSGLTTFWIGGSLQISPEEQLAFWVRLYEGQLPIAPAAVAAVKQAVLQPRGKVLNALGEHSFAEPWPADAVVSAKTGRATDRSGRGVRWLAGHVRRNGKSYVFVSCVTGSRSLDAYAATDLAASELRKAKVL